MRKSVLEINLIVVVSVGKLLQTKEICEDIRQSILEWNLTVVRSVGNHLHGKAI